VLPMSNCTSGLWVHRSLTEFNKHWMNKLMLYNVLFQHPRLSSASWKRQLMGKATGWLLREKSTIGGRSFLCAGVAGCLVWLLIKVLEAGWI
jgi:hypothetical protein